MRRHQHGALAIAFRNEVSRAFKCPDSGWSLAEWRDLVKIGTQYTVGNQDPDAVTRELLRLMCVEARLEPVPGNRNRWRLAAGRRMVGES